MAEVEIAPNFGAELMDGFKPVNAWVNNGIAWLEDIQIFYRERSAIEKEYSQKLSALAKKYFEKKAKKQSSLSVGDTPTVTPGSLESASMTTWTVQLTTLESRANEHEQFSQQLIASLAEPLKSLQSRYEELRKQHADYAAKIEKERDNGYAELKKTKGKYDGACQEVENKRKKTESSFDHGKGKAQAAYNNQVAEMKNVKNSYLIAINVTNKQKERYYHEFVPELLDSLQGLNEARTTTLNNMWSRAADMETQALSRSTQLVQHLSAEIPRNNPVLDSMMFVRHNASQWSDPLDFAFEPSPVWLDDDSMAADPGAKTFLMNILTKSKGSLGELKRESDAKRREVDKVKSVRQAIREGKAKNDEVEVVRAQFSLQEQLHDVEKRRVTAEVEVSTILNSVGDVSIGAKNHNFTPQTYKLPTNCDLCGDRLWGLSAKGLACSDCGFVCHTKCQLKVPAECPGELDKAQQKTMKVRRQEEAQSRAAAPPAPTENGNETGRSVSALQRSDTVGSMNTLSSGYSAGGSRSVSGNATRTSTSVPDAVAEQSSPAAASAPAANPPPARRRVMAPPPAQYIKPEESNGSAGGEQRGKMLYAYQASGDGEITVNEGQEIVLMEPDDGSGWIKVKPTSFGSTPGLVPASYAELSASRTLPARPISTATAASASSNSLAGSIADSINSKPKKVGPAVAPRRGAKKVKHVEAMYTYDANADGETSMEEGERMILVTPDQGDGWCEVESRAGKGVVPAGWVREV